MEYKEKKTKFNLGEKKNIADEFKAEKESTRKTRIILKLTNLWK